MIEPEMAWAELDDNMDVAEDFLKYLFRYALEKCTEEMDFFGQWVEKRSAPRWKAWSGPVRTTAVYGSDNDSRKIR